MNSGTQHVQWGSHMIRPWAVLWYLQKRIPHLSTNGLIVTVSMTRPIGDSTPYLWQQNYPGCILIWFVWFLITVYSFHMDWFCLIRTINGRTAMDFIYSKQAALKNLEIITLTMYVKLTTQLEQFLDIFCLTIRNCVLISVNCQLEMLNYIYIYIYHVRYLCELDFVDWFP